MEIKNIPAPYIDRLVNSCQSYPEVENIFNSKHLTSTFDMICCIEKQGDDEFRNLWISAERGKIEDFGDFNEYLEDGEVSNKKDFEDLWHYYYPDKIKWYETDKNCGGHPWEIYRGGNSTHISLYVCQDEKGWYLRLEGSSRVRETIKIAIAFYKHDIPFILG